MGTVLAEASPHDIKWGIGLEADDPRARQRHRWRGRNLLGEVLMEVRDMLANGYDAADISVPQSTIYYTDNFVLVCTFYTQLLSFISDYLILFLPTYSLTIHHLWQ